ncbi:MAG TPA: DUF5691 domain-containing protein [Caldilineaceae bacterium]|nr:DUF5691 domain-containing protein [Caldilineaceae bacterium]
MTAWQQLVQQGILGTSRQPSAPPLPPAIAALMAGGQEEADAETHFLQHAALLTQYEAAGALPSALDEASGLGELTPAPAESLHPVGARAAALLHQLLADFDLRLVVEWLGYAARNGQYLPHETLPALFDLAGKQRSLPAALAPCIGERGRWLLALNPLWQATMAEACDANQWQMGNTNARATYLTELRHRDPEAARQALEAVWHEEAAAERAAFVATLRANLSAADLPFLEEALADRSRNVRIVAGRLLVALPQSTPHRALLEELRTYLQIERKWLKRQLVVTLPKYVPDQWHEWGIREQSPLGVRIGQKMGWLVQLIALVPPSTLVDALGVDAVDLLNLIRATDHAEALLTALLEGAEQHQDFTFLLAELCHLLRLLKLAQAQQSEFVDRFSRYAPILPAAERIRLVEEYLTITKTAAFGDWTTLQMVFRHVDALPPRMTHTLLTEQLPLLLMRNTRDYGIGRILLDLAYQLAPAEYATATTTFRAPPGEERPDYIDRFLQIYDLRRQIAEAFAG